MEKKIVPVKVVQKKKDIKTMIVPIVSIVALGVGSALGFNHGEIDTLKETLDTLVTVGFSAFGLYGVWKSHNKKVK
jgi:hypothetical protein